MRAPPRADTQFVCYARRRGHHQRVRPEHDLLDGVDRIELERREDPVRRRRIRQSSLSRPDRLEDPRRNAAHRHVRECEAVAEGHGGKARQRMPAARADQHRVHIELLDVEIVLGAEGAGLPDEELDLARAQPAQQFVPVAHRYAHDDPRVGGDEPRERIGEHGLGRIRSGADVHVAAVQAPLARQVAVEVLGELHDLADPGDQHAPTVGELDAARGADEQAAAHVALHRLDAARERGLAEPENRRRARETAMVGEGDHVTHAADFERHASHSTTAMQSCHARRACLAHGGVFCA